MGLTARELWAQVEREAAAAPGAVWHGAEYDESGRLLRVDYHYDLTPAAVGPPDHPPNDAEYEGPKTHAEWRKQFGGIAPSTFYRARRDRKIRCIEMPGRMLLVHRDDVRRLTRH